MNCIYYLLFLSLCPFFALKATIHPAEAAQLLESAHINDYAELNRLLNNNPALLEYAFSSNNPQLLGKIYTIQADNLTALKIDIIECIANTLIEKAFAKGDPFRYEFITPLFAQNLGFLLISFNAFELCNNIQKMLMGAGYTMSHLFFIVDQNNLLNGNYSHQYQQGSHVKIEAKILNNSTIYLIKFDEFNYSNFSAMKDTIISALDSNINMIFDLRKNSGGYISVLEELLGLFIPAREIALVAQKNTIAQYCGRTDFIYDEEVLFEHACSLQGPNDWFITPRSMGRNIPDYQGKIALLVGPDTHSAAENFAYALYLHANATMIGTTTSGNSLISLSEKIKNTITLSYPIGAMIFPEGLCFEGTGIAPTLDTNKIETDECFKIWLAY